MTLEELRAKADADLGAASLRVGVLLEWAFLNAEAHGELAVVEKYLERLPMGGMPSWLEAARKDLARAVSCLRATEHVMALIERRAGKADAPLRSVPAGQGAAK